ELQPYKQRQIQGSFARCAQGDASEIACSSVAARVASRYAGELSSLRRGAGGGYGLLSALRRPATDARARAAVGGSRRRAARGRGQHRRDSSTSAPRRGLEDRDPIFSRRGGSRRAAESGRGEGRPAVVAERAVAAECVDDYARSLP